MYQSSFAVYTVHKLDRYSARETQARIIKADNVKKKFCLKERRKGGLQIGKSLHFQPST